MGHVGKDACICDLTLTDIVILADECATDIGAFAGSTIRDVDLQEHEAAFGTLPKGSYTYSVSVLLSTGNSHLLQCGTYEV